MNPKEIFSNLTERYANCATYRDKGCLYSWRENNQKTRKPQIVFKTYFEWPSKLRFEWQDDSSKSLIWCDGTQAYSCNDFHNSGPEKELCENYGMAIAGAHGVSRGSASLVTDLLFDDLRTECRWLLIREDEKLVGSEPIGDIECYCIQGSNFSPNDTKVWISAVDWSLKRYLHLTVKDKPQSNSWSANQSANEPKIDLSLMRKVWLEMQERKNLVSPGEIADFRNLFADSSAIVDEEVHGDGNYFTEINIEKVEFGTRISPAVFTHIRREIDDF